MHNISGIFSHGKAILLLCWTYLCDPTPYYIGPWPIVPGVNVFSQTQWMGLDDTRPGFPTALHGKQMAVGYSGMNRSGVREPVEPFDTKAVTAAAGFTSTVNDLARFASWQFSTLAGEQNAILDPLTLREMQRVHWVDPDWKTTWGLGFVVSELEGTSAVSHGGGCPGYITQFLLVPKYKVAAIALTNAGDGPAGKIARTMLEVMRPALKAATASSKKANTVPSDSDDVHRAIDLGEFEGNYGGGVWGGETAIRVWGDQLASIRLPVRTRLNVTKLKHVEGDTFVRLTKEGEERETLTFIRSSFGEVAGVKRHSNIQRKIN